MSLREWAPIRHGVVEWWCEAKERSLKIEPDLVQVGKFPDLDVVNARRLRSFSHRSCEW